MFGHGRVRETAPEDVLSLSYTWSFHKKERIPFGWCFQTHPMRADRATLALSQRRGQTGKLICVAVSLRRGAGSF